MHALEQVDGWPVEHVAAGVANARAVMAVRGDADATFPLASVTKLLTATALLVACEEETVALDEPAGPPGSTVRHLLAHASGLAPDTTAVLAPPGHRRIYSNTGFDLLGALVAARSGLAFGDYLDEAVLAPLGLRSTRLPAGASPASGAVGAVGDLLTLGRELLAPTILAPATIAEATSTAFPGLAGVLPGFGRQDPNDWGLGFEIRDAKAPHWTGTANSPRTFGHFGRTGTFLWIDPAAGLACASLTDRAFGPWAADAWPRLADAVVTEAAADRDSGPNEPPSP